MIEDSPLNPEPTHDEKRKQQLDFLAGSLARKRGWTVRRARRHLERLITKGTRFTELPGE